MGVDFSKDIVGSRVSGFELRVGLARWDYIMAYPSVAPLLEAVTPFCHTKSFKVVLQKSIPTKICQLIIYISNSKR
jgi:hypothetical protein